MRLGCANLRLGNLRLGNIYLVGGSTPEVSRKSTRATLFAEGGSFRILPTANRIVGGAVFAPRNRNVDDRLLQVTQYTPDRLMQEWEQNVSARTEITARPYGDGGDLRKLQEALASWIAETGERGQCHVGDLAHRIYNGLRGTQPLDQVIRLWESDKELVAMALCHPRAANFDVFVSPQFRGSEVEREALHWGQNTVWNRMPAKQREKGVFTDIVDGDDVRVKLVTEMGFTGSEEPWIAVNERSLDGDLPEAPLPDGFTIRPAAGEEDAAQLAAVHSSAFGSKWTEELYRDEVMRKPGYAADRERVVVAPNGQLAAFCIVWFDEVNKVGLFEPVGTHQDFHRRGLAKALLTHGFRFMRDRGMEIAQVGCETSNEPSIRLYSSLGFAPRYTVSEFKYLGK